MSTVSDPQWAKLMTQVDAVLTELHLELEDWESVGFWLSGAIARRDFDESEGGRDGE